MWIQGWVEEMPEQDEVGVVGDCALERRQLARAQRAEALVDPGKSSLRADRGVAVAGKVFGRGEHARHMDPIHHRADGRRDLRRRGAVAASPHDRGRAGADIGDRAEVEVKTEGLERGRHRSRVLLPDRHGLTRNRADRDANPTALLVCGDQQSMPLDRAELLDEGAQIVSRCSVVVEVDDQQAAVLVPRPVGEH